MGSDNRCIRCALPFSFPTMTFTKDGLCEVCARFEQKWKPWLESKELQAESERKLIRILDRAKAKGKLYDCVIGISGGKDSLYTLYLAVKRYGMNPLAVSIDNGFLTDEAKQVIDKACKKLRVDYIIYRLDMIYELYRHVLLKTGSFCSVCFIMIIQGLRKFTKSFDIPIALIGKSSRLDCVSPRGGNPFFFSKVCEGSKNGIKRPYMFGRGGYFGLMPFFLFNKMVKIPDYVMWDYNEIRRVLKEEMDIDMFTEHDDCWAFPIKQHLMVRRYGFGQKFLKAGVLCRNNMLSREDAIKLNEKELAHKEQLPPVAERFISTLNITMEDFERLPEISSDKYYSGFGNWLLLQRHKLLRGRA